METKDIPAVMFAAVAIIGVLGGIGNRIATKRGIGAQFIKFIAPVVALPLAGAFVFQGMLTPAVVSLLLGILGYVFPGSAKEV
jgi:hypothetical protein